MTFARWAAAADWAALQHAHFDWWMFPFLATDLDSPTARRFSVLPGDVADLLLVPGFAQRYEAGARALLASHAAGRSAVTAAMVHPARRPKVLCSARYFAAMAGTLRLADAERALLALERDLQAAFGLVEDAYYAAHIGRW